MTDRNALIEEWTQQARELGHQHATGLGSDDQPTDAIDLNAWEEATGEGMSWGETAEIQAKLEEAYEDAKRNAVWAMLENPPKHCEAAADLYHWSTNFDSGQGPFTLYLDLIGYSADEFGEAMYAGPKDYSLMGYMELGKLGRALNEYADAPRDVEEWVRQLLAAEVAD